MSRISEYVKRRPVLTVFLVALGVRLSMVAVGQVIPESWIANDDTTYSRLAEQMARGDTAGWSPYLSTLYSATATFLVPLTGLFWLIGPVEWVGEALVALVGAGVAGVTVRLALERLGTVWAISAGGVVALLPSQVAWSVVMLKDPWVWLSTAGLAVLVSTALRSRGRRLVVAVMGISVVLFLLGHLRLQTTFVAALALVATAMFVPKNSRLGWVIGALLVAVCVPWLAGGGPGGIDPVLARAGNFEQTRLAGAAGAESGVVSPDPTAPQREEASAGSVWHDVAHLPRGLSVMLLEPYPWDPNRNLRVIFAKIDTILWYPILGIALVGVGQVRKHPRVLVFPTLVGAGMLVGYALAEGNLGTAFRHRGELVWIVALLAAFGARSLWERRQSGRTTPIRSFDGDLPGTG